MLPEALLFGCVRTKKNIALDCLFSLHKFVVPPLDGKGKRICYVN
jgi:hypothetical protein